MVFNQHQGVVDVLCFDEGGLIQRGGVLRRTLARMDPAQLYTDCIGILMPENDVMRNADWLVVTADLRPPFVISDAWHIMR